MPTCDNKTKPSSIGSLTAAELDHHASEAAKVKRTKDQAYFNSYDFDAIEVLPYDDDDDDDRDRTHPLQHHHHHHGSHSGYRPKYTLGECKACHSTASPVPAVHHSSHSLNSRPHQLPQSKKPIKLSSSRSNISHCSSTTSTPSSSLSSFTHPSQPARPDSKRTYLKRISAFFHVGKGSTNESLDNEPKKQKQQTDSTAASSSQVSSNGSNVRAGKAGRLYEVGAGGSGNIGSSGSTSINNRDHVISDTMNSNFLLPRAMLKHQSTGFGNSMPLSVISNLGGGSSSSLKSNSIRSQLNTTVSLKPPHATLDSSITATDAIPITNGNLKKPPPNHIVAAVENSGFTSSSSSASSSVSASSSSLAKSSSLTTNSSLCAESSSIIRETNTSADVSGSPMALATANVGGVASGAPVTSKSITNSNVVSSITTSGLEQSLGSKLPSSSSSSSEVAADIATGTRSTPTTTSGSGDAATAGRSGSSRRGARERTSSQSHYSTDKSGSSGYYSSNVCSTYSVEDHIYCEPVIDILEVGGKTTTLKSSKPGQPDGKGPRKIMIVHNSDDDDEDHYRRDRQHHLQQQNVKHNLRILETSIENLDRHLKNYPKLSVQDRISSFARLNPPTVPTNFFQIQNSNGNQLDSAKNRYGQLPTIMEGGTVDGQTATVPKSWRDEIAEDSLLDIDLDSFLLVSEKRPKNSSVGGIDNPTFDKSEILHDEDMENNYKCVKYINSCPEDAYKLENEMGNSVDHFVKKYEDQIHFQNTRELLEDVRDKIRLLSESAEGIDPTSIRTDGIVLKTVPKELESMIEALKSELESYLERMNHHSEMEIRQLCTGLVKNQNIVKMKKAFERRKSNASESEYDLAYEAIRDGGTIVTVQHTRQQIETTSIRCTSDPNFKMKRKSLCEVFPTVEVEHSAGTSSGTLVAVTSSGCGGSSGGVVGGIVATSSDLVVNGAMVASGNRTQLQRNLSFHKPILNKLGGSGEVGGEGDKDSILDWHRKKPSIWEMYYGTNRMNQTLLGKRGVITNGNQAILSYPSSRPESDFTLDLPRAEQLRIKMEKEKKFRRRCRYLTTFLSLVFFLLTVMVVSLVLTRGKRMFGSMI